ncbi:uncharacterized protein LOC144507913 isoform X11 [Mustelus asterias]
MKYSIFLILWALSLLKDDAFAHQRIKRAYLIDNYESEGSTVRQNFKYARDVSAPSIEGPRTCSTWGQGVIRTYTDEFYYFVSNCKYILSRQCQGDAEDFNVEIRRGSNGNLEHIFMKIEGAIIIVVNGTIQVKGTVVSLPYDDKVISIQQYGVNVRLSNRKHTIILIWNYKDALQITVGAQYQSKLCGLCGPFDSSVSTTYDLTYTRQSKLDPSYYSCDIAFPEEKSCQSANVCSGISDIFQSCTSTAIKDKYLEMCQKEVCACQEASQCSCATFAAMALQCVHSPSSSWKTWRQTTGCKIPTCPGNQIYMECGPVCMSTCTDPNPQQQCNQCVNTCGCPEDIVLDNIRGNDQCISQAECPCRYGGTVYNSGQIRNSFCQSCLCQSGMWNCSDLNCPETCTIEEETHITTFDGNYYNLIGDCSYYAIVTKDWSLKIEMHPGQAAYKQTRLQRVTYTIFQDAYIFNNDGSVDYNGNIVGIPVVNAHILIFQQSSIFLQVSTALGLKMQIQISPIMQLYISLPKSAKGSTKGLCGTFNDNADDDFLSAQGIVELTYVAFSNSWRENDACPSPQVNPTCVSSENENYAKENCAYLKDPAGAFAKCHSEVEFVRFYEMCKLASCNCEKINDCVCAAFQAYSHACAEKGIIVDNWRRSICSVSCPNTQVFQYNMRACNRTCRFLSGPDRPCEVQDVPVDGCGCPEGKYVNEDGTCVDRSECPCYVAGFIVQSGQPVNINGVQCYCVNGVPSCPNNYGIPQDCSGKLYSNCSNSSTCKKTCQTLNKPCPNPCVPGCVCPEGLVEDYSGNCIQPAQCPCSFGGEIFVNGATIKNECNNCTCNGGSWACTTEPCPKTCLVYGDGHYISFDGRRYSYDGNCEYIFIEDKCQGAIGTFQILLESVPCCENGVTCSRNIRILLKDRELILLSGNGITEVSLGQSQCTDNFYSLHTVGLYLVLTFSNGITVIWDKRTRLSVTLDTRWKDKVCGLCGNFNDNIEDDLTTKGNYLVTSSLEFGNSWKTTDSCSNAVNETFPCERNPYCLTWAQKRCHIIKGAEFQACHKKVDPSPYYDACVAEACACDLEGKYLGFCTAVAVYAEACNRADVCIRWRTPDLCPVYCDYYNTPGECSWHYHPCGTLTTKTCSDHSIGKKFSSDLEGCYAKCPENAPYLDENTMKCVTLPQCTCYYDGRILQPGEVSWNSCEKCMCTNGITQCNQITTTTVSTTVTTTASSTLTPLTSLTTTISTITSTETTPTTETTTTPASTTSTTTELTSTTVSSTTTGSTTETTSISTETTTTATSTASSTSETTATSTEIASAATSTASSTPESTTTTGTSSTTETTAGSTTELTSTTVSPTTTGSTTEETTSTTAPTSTSESTARSTTEGITATVPPTTTGSTSSSTTEGTTSTTVPTTTSESTASSTTELTSTTVSPTTTGSTTGSTTETTTTSTETTSTATSTASSTPESTTTTGASSSNEATASSTTESTTTTVPATTTGSTSSSTTELTSTIVSPTTTGSTTASTTETITTSTETTSTVTSTASSTPESTKTTGTSSTTETTASSTTEETTSTTVPTTTSESPASSAIEGTTTTVSPTTTGSTSSSTTEETTSTTVPTTTSESTARSTTELTSTTVSPTTTGSTTGSTTETSTTSTETTSTVTSTASSTPEETTSTTVPTTTSESPASSAIKGTTTTVSPTTTGSTSSSTAEETTSTTVPTTTSESTARSTTALTSTTVSPKTTGSTTGSTTETTTTSTETTSTVTSAASSTPESTTTTGTSSTTETTASSTTEGTTTTVSTSTTGSTSSSTTEETSTTVPTTTSESPASSAIEETTSTTVPTNTSESPARSTTELTSTTVSPTTTGSTTGSTTETTTTSTETTSTVTSTASSTPESTTTTGTSSTTETTASSTTEGTTTTVSTSTTGSTSSSTTEETSTTVPTTTSESPASSAIEGTTTTVSPTTTGSTSSSTTEETTSTTVPTTTSESTARSTTELTSTTVSPTTTGSTTGSTTETTTTSTETTSTVTFTASSTPESTTTTGTSSTTETTASSITEGTTTTVSPTTTGSTSSSTAEETTSTTVPTTTSESTARSTAELTSTTVSPTTTGSTTGSTTETTTTSTETTSTVTSTASSTPESTTTTGTSSTTETTASSTTEGTTTTVSTSTTGSTSSSTTEETTSTTVPTTTSESPASSAIEETTSTTVPTTTSESPARSTTELTSTTVSPTTTGSTTGSTTETTTTSTETTSTVTSTASSTPESTTTTGTSSTSETTTSSTTEGTTTTVSPTTTGSTSSSTTEETTSTTVPTTTSESPASSTTELTTTTVQPTTTGLTIGSTTEETTSTTVPTTTSESTARSTTEVTTTTVPPTTTGSTSGTTTEETTVTTTTSRPTTASSTTEETTAVSLTTTTGSTIGTTTDIPCNGIWSGWINVHTPSLPTDTTDYEPLDPTRNYVCNSATDQITNIHCEAVRFPGYPFNHTGDSVSCDIHKGLVCHQPAPGAFICMDYRIRVCCQPSKSTTPPISTTTVSTTTTPEECLCDSNPPRKCNETWREGCSTFTCVIEQTYKITNVACEQPVKPTCYSGLLPVRITTEGGCCSTWDCNCECQLWGNDHYRTFDGLSYNFRENCTYALVQEIVPRYNFSVILDNYHCIPQVHNYCPKKLIINYNGNVIHFTTGRPPTVTVNGVAVQFLYRAKGINVTKTNNRASIFIPDIRATITGHQRNFRIQVPEQYFLDNTQGQCGTCTRNKNDDCVRRNGRIESPDCCHKTALDWKIDDPRKPYCQAAPTNIPCDVPPTPPSCECGNTVCDVISGNSFAICQNKHELSKYIEACQYDHCTVNSTEMDCANVRAAAMACSAAGACVDWRDSTNGSCSINCTEGFVYRACSRYNHNYCKDGVMKPGERFVERTEGCFCPSEMMLSEDGAYCVPSCTRCKDSSGNIRKEGESWSHPNDTCAHYKCSKGVVIEMQFSCSLRPNCSESDRIWDKNHCCYSCHEPLGRCKVKSKPLEINKTGCLASVQMNYCEGSCNSFSIFNSTLNGMQRHCECCVEYEIERKVANLACRDGTTQSYSYTSAKSCTCGICNN